MNDSERVAAGIFALVVRRPVAVWMIAIAAAVFGLVSYQRLALDLMPDLSYPSITVRTEALGYAPEEVEGQVSRPIEEALATTEGLVELESRSRASTSDVVLEFTWGTDMDRAAQDVRERLQTTFLPDDVGRPLILRYDPSLDPILRISLSEEGPKDEDPEAEERRLLALRELAEREIKRELEAMDGVAAVRVRGGLERQVLVEARQDWLAARGVTVEQLVATLGSENVNLPGGAIRDGDQEFLVRTLNEVRTVEEISALEIRRPDGMGVPVREVARVRETHKDREVMSRLDSRPAVTLEVFKTADANIVRVARSIKERLGSQDAPAAALPAGMPKGPPTLVDTLPAGVRLVVLEDQAEFIEQSLANLRSTALMGAVLAVGILFLFLRDFRATAIIGAAIPLSIIVTFAPMYLGGVSLNLMSLGGLALGIGMLVDNAVVVLENIQNHVDRGLPRRQAAERGTQEMAAAVIASTLTTVAVFLPIRFVEGIAGQIFGDLALAVVFSLLASLVVALFFVPVLAATEFRLQDLARSADLPADADLRTRARALLQASRSTRFASWAQLRAGWQARTGGRRWLWAPYAATRFLLRLSFELLVALVILPLALVARVGAGLGAMALPRISRPLLWAADRFMAAYGRFADAYRDRMAGVLRRGGLVLGLAAVAVAVSLPLAGNLGQALIPEVHQGRFTAELALPVGTPLPRTSSLSARVEERLQALPGVAHVHAVVGSEQRADSGSDEGEHTARVVVELTPGGDLAAREDALMARVRDEVAAVARQELGPTRLAALPVGADGQVGAGAALSAAGIELRLARPGIFSFRTPIEVVLYDRDLDDLRRHAGEATAAMVGLPGLADVRSSMVQGYPEVRIRYDRDLLERFGLDTGTVARRVREQVQGAQATTLSRGTGRVDLTVRLAEEERRSIDDLRRINVNPELVPAIPLEAVASFEEALGPSEIRRIDQQRAAVVTANIDGFDLSGQARVIQGALDRLELPAGAYEIAGQNREMQRSMQSLQLALALAVFLVYVIMASTFESVIHPFVILFSVPLALVGVVAALGLSGTPVSVVVLIGAIVLAGVVVNNAIVLVDAINRLRDEGAELDAAVQRACALRLRPILITTTTTVLGLLPLAFGLGEGAEIQQPLAVTVIAGLSSSTLLTLVVIPVVYRTVAALRARAEPAA
ncbi:efflux RND transporter permease subunit [Myxococcota bacterium]|nr:efflux RND transporter permease subunit [Myxococcota bacterium]